MSQPDYSRFKKLVDNSLTEFKNRLTCSPPAPLEQSRLQDIYSAFVNFKGDGVDALFIVNATLGSLRESGPPELKLNSVNQDLTLDWVAELTNLSLGAIRESMARLGVFTTSGPPVGEKAKERKVVVGEGDICFTNTIEIGDFEVTTTTKAKVTPEFLDRLNGSSQESFQKVEVF